MKRIAQLKLQPTPEQADALLRTLETANQACDSMSRIAWESKTFSKFQLQTLCYTDVRETFALTAQMVFRLLAKVGDAYRIDKKVCRTFRPHGSIAYDDRILRCRWAHGAVPAPRLPTVLPSIAAVNAVPAPSLGRAARHNRCITIDLNICGKSRAAVVNTLSSSTLRSSLGTTMSQELRSTPRSRATCGLTRRQRSTSISPIHRSRPSQGNQ